MIIELVLSALLWTLITAQFNMFNTDHMLDNDRLHVNCLHYNTWVMTQGTEKIEYCLGPTIENRQISDEFVNTRDQNFTFEQLYKLKITSDQLLAWSAVVDLAERYQDYISHPNDTLASKELFVNCSIPWFGPRCEYSFVPTTIYSFENVLRRKWQTTENKNVPDGIMYITCYVHLQCKSDGSTLCLDWREICDGHIDCLDGGVDEARCFELEVNECEENQYRCHNGLCIAKEFLDDEDPQCLDTSDIIENPSSGDTTDRTLRFDHEEHLCRPGKKRFPCGDGNCVPYLEHCKTGRHLYLIESMSRQGNLSRECWIAIICLTKILNETDGISCINLLNSSIIDRYIQSCDDVVQFPVIPIAFGHVRFLYLPKNAHDYQMDGSLKPYYICYDTHLCDFLPASYIHGQYACRRTDELDLDFNIDTRNWKSLVLSVRTYFLRCLTQTKQNNSHHPSLYCCKNSSKCISKSRVLDGFQDCYLNDDEQAFNISCSIKNGLRLNCTNENKCYSPLIQKEMCSLSRLRHLDKIKFEHICDRVVHLFPILSDGKNYTDETECDKWPCNNHYTRCNGFWNCRSGEDEENCRKLICPRHHFPCISVKNYTLICLPAEQVADRKTDCLGAADEMEYCRRDFPHSILYAGFRCMNSTKCLPGGNLCDDIYDCPLLDDEAVCNGYGYKCDNSNAADRTDIEEVMCLFLSQKRLPFLLSLVPSYPIIEQKITLPGAKSLQQRRHQLISVHTERINDPLWAWRCNHGVYVLKLIGDNKLESTCFCPPNYYGNYCQYQSQRVSLTLRVRAINPNTIMAIVATLIEDDDRQEINAAEQFTSTTFRHCEQNFNAYLTYRTRPKNISKNYSVHIDAFDKLSLTYISSWHFKVPFSFLPVNRIAVVVTVPINPVSNIYKCPIKCQNGKCIKYLNEERYFCRCDSGWSGGRCHIKIRSDDCSNDSVCIGMIHNRSICVCPVHKWGPRCLLNLTCSEDVCENGGHCFLTLDRKNHLGYVCMCPIEFTGVFCHIPKHKLEVSFNTTKESLFILLYIFHALSSSYYLDSVTLKVIPYKITMYQRHLSIYTTTSLRLVFAKFNSHYYLIVSQQLEILNVSTSINSQQRCLHVNELLKDEHAVLPVIRRIKYYHALCETHRQLLCFFDDLYICLCSHERHAHCFNFEHTPPKCQHDVFCQNGAECWQDDAKCPTTTVCVCAECFFGSQCQFYGKGIGLTLDDIFRYEIQPNATINKQSRLVKSSIAFAVIILVIGWINSILSMLTFRTKRSRDVGSGIYLSASSITSFLTVNIFTVKYWFLISTQINTSVSRLVFLRCCTSFEYILKVCYCTDNWFNACVALERMIIVRTLNLNKDLSKRAARWTIFITPFIVGLTLLHEPLHRDVLDDQDEQHRWCAFRYSRAIHSYNTFILLFHFVGPLIINITSALFITFGGIHLKIKSQREQVYHRRIRQQLREHKSFIISPIALVISSIPRLIISLLSGCMKTSSNTWLYLMGYNISFLPSISVFFVFVVPSEFYMNQFKTSIRSFRRRNVR